MSSDSSSWRRDNLNRLRERNRKESLNFKDIIWLNNRLLDSIQTLKNENIKIIFENEKLRSSGPSGSGDATTNSIISSLEKKLLAQQEQLTELHKRKGENAQMIVDLNKKLEKQSAELLEKEQALAEQININNSLRAEIQMLKNNLEELKGLNTILKDEHTALQLAFGALEEKYRKTADENRTLVERLIKYKSKDADKLNEENETFLKKRSDKVRRDLEEAARENRSPSPVMFPGSDKPIDLMSGAPSKMIGFYSHGLPTKVHLQFNAHDGEVNAVRWSPVERLIATGGTDRKVKLWDVGKTLLEPRGALVGSNAGINSIDFDSTGSMLLGTSNDFASRVWTITDQRLRHTLTGHSGKVMAAKFLQESSKVVSGSHDRTLKIWDLRNRACIETKFAGSSCNDLVTTDSSGSTIISGHFDKKIRFWDTRSADCSANDILLPGKITSLDLSKDCKYLISCVRDDTIRLLDLRMNQIINTFSHDNFKVSCDWARVSFNNDATRIAAGSADGSIFIWNTGGKLETTLMEHSVAVNAVSWHSVSSVLASVDKGKKCIIWVDA